MTYVILKDYDISPSHKEEYIFSQDDISEISLIWNKMDDVLTEITKIDFCKKIKKWKDVDQDLLRLILLSALINNKDKSFISVILKIILFSIQKTLINCNINFITLVKFNNELDIDINLNLSTKEDSEKRLSKQDQKSKLVLIVDNTKE